MMMRSRFALPLRGRDLGAGFLLWLGLVLAASGGAGTGLQGAGRAGIVIGGLAAMAFALSWVMPYVRPWPLAQWRAWRGRRGMAWATRRPLTMIFPSAYRSAFGLIIGEWLGARALDLLHLADTTMPGGLPLVGALIVLAVIAINGLLDS